MGISGVGMALEGFGIEARGASVWMQGRPGKGVALGEAAHVWGQFPQEGTQICHPQGTPQAAEE